MKQVDRLLQKVRKAQAEEQENYTEILLPDNGTDPNAKVEADGFVHIRYQKKGAARK